MLNSGTHLLKKHITGFGKVVRDVEEDDESRVPFRFGMQKGDCF
jgi:hypothetical protein